MTIANIVSFMVLLAVRRFHPGSVPRPVQQVEATASAVALPVR